MAKGHALLGSLSPEKRLRLPTKSWISCARGFASSVPLSGPLEQEQIRNRSFTDLKEPWGLTEEERRAHQGSYLIPRSRPRQWQVNVDTLSPLLPLRNSADGSKPELLGARQPPLSDRLRRIGLQRHRGQSFKDPIDLRLCPGRRSRKWASGVSVDASVLEWRLGRPEEPTGSVNRFFRTLYENIAGLLGQGDRFLQSTGSPGNTQLRWTEERVLPGGRRFRGDWPPERVVNGQVEGSGPSGPLLLSHHGARRRYLHPQHGLSSKRSSHTGQLRPKEWTSRTKRSACPRGDLLRSEIAPRPIFLRRPTPHGGRSG